MERRPFPRLAALLGLIGLAAYNWWIYAAFGGLVGSPDGMFSDLEANGVPHAVLFGRLDVVAGVLICLSLMLRGMPHASDRRQEWGLLMGFGVAGIVGGLSPYACPEGRDSACRRAEWAFQLPLHHYVHMGSGIVEFALITLAVALMWRRLRVTPPGLWRRVAATLGISLVVGYPALAGSYLLDRWDAPVEAYFFAVFAAMFAATLLEPEADQPRIERARATSPAIASSSSSTESKRTMPRSRSTKDTSTWRS